MTRSSAHAAASFPDSHCKCSKHDNSFMSCELVHEEVRASDGLAIFSPSLPGSSFAVVCSSRNFSLMGNCCSSDGSQELISLGRGDITKWSGI
jgi:hypothetical protein